MFAPDYHFTPEGAIFLSEEDTLQNRDSFVNYLEHYVQREGIEGVIVWLVESTDFFNAPCSTAYHLNITGGLALHSMKVFQIFNTLCEMFSPEFPKESRAICALLHDVCKVNVYRPALKSRKTGEYWPNGKPKWEDYLAYDFDDPFPYGHGEKSVYLIMKHMPLTDEEAMAIRWHMGSYDSSAKSDTRTLGNATTKYPVISLLHAADLIATSQGF